MSERDEFRCPALVEGLRRLASELASRLNASYPAGAPLRRTFKLGPNTAEETTRPDWEVVILVSTEKIIDCEAYKAVAAAVQSDPVISEHERQGYSTAIGGGSMSTETWVPWFLASAFEGQRHAQVIEGRIAALYRDLEDFFYSNTVPIRGLGPLHGLDLPCEQIEIGNGVSLVRLSAEQRNEFYTEWGHHASSLGTFRGMETTALQVDLEIPKVLGQGIMLGGKHPSNDIDERMYRAVSGLRLLKRGSVGISTIRVRPARWNPFVGGFGPGGILNDWVLGGYHLREAEGPKLREMHAALQDAEGTVSARLLNSVRRFNLTQERADLADRLVDCVVGLEGLYLPDRGSELKYRLSLRAAVHLGQEPEERWRIFNVVQAAYDARSTEVHGDRSKMEISVGDRPMPLHEFVEEACEVLRRGLAAAMLSRASDLRQWVRSLDASLLGATISPRPPR